MRLWSLHPKYLDAKGFGGLWNEALQCQDVILGITNMHKNHSGAIRWKRQADPLQSLSNYLNYIYQYSVDTWNYNYNRNLIIYRDHTLRSVDKMPVTSGQIEYEARHLLAKLERRSFDDYLKFSRIVLDGKIEPNPLFTVVDGPIESWEKI